MISTGIKPQNIDEYIAGFSKDIQATLQQLRTTINTAAPGATEVISYQMPAFKLNGNSLLYFAACKNHIGFYPTSSGIRTFSKELSVYKGSKGAVQFPISQPLPLGLISRIVKFRVKENLAKIKATRKNNR